MTLFDTYHTLSGLYLNPDELARLMLFGTDDAGRESALLFAFTDRLIAEARAGELGVKLWNPEHLDPTQPEPPPRVSVLDAMVWALKHPPRETADDEDPGLQIEIAADTLEWFTRLRPPQ